MLQKLARVTNTLMEGMIIMLAKTQAIAIKYATAKNTMLPILNCVEIGEAYKEGFRSLHVNNLDYAVIVYTPDSNALPIGSILIDKDTALQCLGHPWTLDDGKATFTRNGSERTVETKDLSDYPLLPWDASKVKATVSFDFEEFKADLAYCLRAVSDDLTRPALCGVLLELFGDGMYNLVSTDGHRLHRVYSKTDLSKPLSLKNEHAILESGFCKFLTRLPQKTGTLAMEITDNHVRVALESKGCNVVIVSRQNDGPFPDYRQVIPSDNTQSFFMDDASVFVKACKEIKPNTSKPVSLVTFEFGNGVSSLSCINPDTGNASVQVRNTKLGNGWELDRAAFNVRYLMDCIPKGTEFIEMQGKRVDSAFILRFDGSDRYLSLVMPLRLKD